ncbi:MAG: phosphomannose isomerase type II C-terminal cupin domain [Candidatus Pacebacteria bacterium]|nr:phosphomannose isomerase type II C-terminal cupin domain [Candidatus Paceibacterota bacterium]
MKPSEVTNKPWGHFRQFTLNQQTTIKTLNVNAGEILSLQTHTTREEYWYVLEGHPQITLGDEIFDAQPGQEIFVTQGQQHRIAAPTDAVVILEIAYGHFDEDDIVRLEDKYNR